MALIERSRFCEAMGTGFEVFLYGEDEEHLEAVAVAVTEEIIRLDGVLSRYDPRSEIARINRDAGSAPLRVDREVFGLLERCEQARRLTEGHFDVTASTSRASATPVLHLDAESGTVQFARPDVVIDLGGVGKGYALDRGREILLRFGVTRGLLDGGTSSVLALGAPPGGRGWPVDVRHPQTPAAAPVARVELIDRGFSCSAVCHPGQEQSDVVNPWTGCMLSGNAACIVLAASATEAEIFSTALLAMGRERAISYLEKKSCPGVNVGWFKPDAGFAWIAPMKDS
ncbi:MAG: FAD:protein FMN transferase [Pyrinomonadaceae bacterium]|nr:FAD:protein FMN transferase [Pyrinomonadaceae bacterium]